MNKELKAIFKRARAEGWVVTTTGGNHFKLQHKTGPIVFVSLSASDWRAFQNIKSDLRRALRTNEPRRAS